MKLYDFFSDPKFCDLRDRMNAPLPQNFKSNTSLNLLSEDEIRKLGTEGIEGSLGDIKIESDGTLSLKGQRVVVYIRDIAVYNLNIRMSKFHMTYCRTLKDMNDKKKFDRYVFTQNDSGKFNVNIIQSNKIRSDNLELDVCQNCLRVIEWNDYMRANSFEEKTKVVKMFTLQKFFEKYPKDILSVRPTYSADTAPLNDYTSDWGIVKERIKKERNYQCESCGESSQKLLDVHHKNSQKNDNRRSNLEVLCVGCHAKEHSHYSSGARFKFYQEQKNVKN